MKDRPAEMREWMRGMAARRKKETARKAASWIKHRHKWVKKEKA